jgi:triosephosphate isomerase
VGKLFDETVARRVRMQYGGSVKPANAQELMSQCDVDGALELHLKCLAFLT